MWRSRPAEGSEKQVVKEDSEEVERRRDYSVFGIYLDKNGIPHGGKPAAPEGTGR